MQIYTLQFPVLGKMNRLQFLNFAQRNVVEYAFKHQDHFKKQGLSAEYFHKDSKTALTEQIPVLIHALEYNNMFTLRAYGEKASETLRFWLHLFAKEHPTITEHLSESLEHLSIKVANQPMFYSSQNWIAINKPAIRNGFYIDLENEKYSPEQVLSKKLSGHLRTFLKYHDAIDVYAEIELIGYPRAVDKILALRSRKGQKVQGIYKQAFSVKIKTNLHLPLYFSLGQNTAYGNGLFIRDF